MKSVFVESTIFEKYRNEYLSDDEFRLFQAELMSNPKQGDVIQGTGGLRKIRVAVKVRASVVALALSITSSMKSVVSTC